ncbi:MAG: hypothetical protein V4733_03615 [Verrucomicrobiota bacterium]
MTIIGLDPGKTGGIAWWQNGEMQAERLPETMADLWNLIFIRIVCGEPEWLHADTSTCCIAYLEEVHSSPQMGVKSAFSFGQTFGRLEMALSAARIPFQRVRPQVWQKAMGCMTRGDKNVSKRRAQELFPHLKITHATADALLIAEYGRRLK